MRRVTIALALCAAATWMVGARQAPPAQAPAKAAQAAPAATVKPAARPVPFTLSVDGLMRGQKLIGSAPSAVRFSPDSSKIYFSWQKPDEERANSWVVNRDGSDLKQLTPEEARLIPPAPAGRADRARNRLLNAEGGNIVIYDLATGARRLLVKTSAAESNPRWARNDTAVTFMRDGNLYLMSLDATTSPTEVQLTDVVSAADSAGAAATGGGQRGAMGGGTGTGQRGTAGAPPRAQAGQAGLTDAQRLLREQELELIEYLEQQAEQRRQGRGGMGGGQRGGRGAMGGPGAGGPAEPIARFTAGARQSVTDMLLSKDENYVFIAVNERPEIAARAQDVPNYVTESAYPEMINGRSNVGDSQSRRRLAILGLKGGQTTWADAASFAGSEKPVKEGEKPIARIVDWSLPDCTDDGAQCVAAVRSADNHDRWLVKIDPATGKATSIDNLHDDAWIREGSVSTGTGGGGGGGFGGGAALAWLPDNRRALYLAERDGWMHVWSIDVSVAAPSPKQLTTGKWEISSARLSNDRTKVYFTASEVHPGEHHFYTMSVDGGPFTRVTTTTGGHEVTVSPDEKTLVDLFSTINRPPRSSSCHSRGARRPGR